MLRPDLDLILDWVPMNTRVLDLGCGDGTLLQLLISHSNCFGYGLETSETFIQSCVEKSVPVIQQDLNRGLTNFDDASFDVVIMTQALQVLRNPHLMLEEMLRIGKEVIITFPNFGYWRNRIYLACKGRMPVSRTLPYSWYDTPNIHLCTLEDFEGLCRTRQLEILQRSVVDGHSHQVLLKWFPNLFGATALYRIRKMA